MMQSVHRFGSVVCCSFVCLLLSANLVRAQAIHEGKLGGTVAGADRAVIPGATVEISSPALLGGPRSGVTSDSGTFLFLNLPIGRYTVKASLQGFKTIVRENIDVSADATVSVDLILEVGEIKETVTVSAAGPIVDTKSSTIDTRFRSEMLEKLPTSRDAFYDLALTAPGMFEGSGAPSQTTEFQSPTAYGSATNENVFLINGVDATSPARGIVWRSRQRQLRLGRGGADRLDGSEGGVRQFLGRGDRRADQVRQQRVPRQWCLLLQARRSREQSTRSQRDFRNGLLVRRRG